MLAWQVLNVRWLIGVDVRIFLFTCFVYTDNSPAIESIYLSTGDGYNHPSAPAYHDGRIANNDGLKVFRSIFSRGEFGGGEIRYGLIDFVNEDGALDAWLNYGWGRCAELSIIDSDADYSTRQVVLSACIEDLTPSSDVFSLQWTPRYQPLLDNPASGGLFAGTGGLDGGDDIKGQRKPRSKGLLRNITPVNLGGRVYAWNYDNTGNRVATHSIDAVYYNGSPWTFHADYPNAAALLAGPHGGNGHYSTCKAESLIMMNGSVSLNATITMDVTIEATAPERYAGTLLDYFLQDAGVPSGDISTDDVNALDTDAPYPLGIYIRDETYADICDMVASSVAAWYLPDRLGVYRMAQIKAPVAEQVTFTRLDLDTVIGINSFELLNIAPVASSDYIPAKEVRVNYNKNWTVIDKTNIAAAVSDANAEFFSKEYRVTDAVLDSDNAAKYLNSQVLTHDTLLTGESEANDIRDLIADLYSVQRREYEATIRYDSEAISLIDIGTVAKIVYPKLGLQNGKLFNIHGVELNVQTNIASLKLWG